MLVAQRIDSLLGGVSQQPAHLRSPSQVSIQTNADSDAARGVGLRPPSESVAAISSALAPWSNPLVHEFTDMYGVDHILMVNDGELVVVRKDTGVIITTSFPSGSAYLTTSKGFRAVTVGDTTYVANRSVTTAKASTLSPAASTEHMVVLRQLEYSTQYTIIISQTAPTTTSFTATYSTAAAPAGTTAPPDSNNVAGALISAINSATSGAYSALNYGGEALYITGASGQTFTVSTSDGLGGQGLLPINGSVTRVEDLPEHARNGAILTVVGNKATNTDDSYWTYSTTTSQWTEVVQPATQIALDATTMPWALTRLGTSSSYVFQFAPATWKQRKAGNTTVVPFPSLVGRTVSEVFHYQGRLGIIAGENVVLSQAGDVTNLFRQTATQLLATDVIDVRSTARDAGQIEHVVEWNETLYLLTRRGPIVLSGEPALSPQTVRMDFLTNIDTGSDCRPATTHRSLYLCRQTGGYSQVLELTAPEFGGLPYAQGITKHVPQFLAGSPKVVVADDAAGFIAVLTNAYRLFVCRIQGDQQDRRQLAWSEWTFPGASISGLHLSEGILYLVTRRSGQQWLEQIDMTDVPTDDTDYRDWQGATSYEMTVELSPLYMRDREGKSETRGRLQVRYLDVHYAATKEFTLWVYPEGRTAQFHRVVNTSPTSGTLRVPVQGRAETTRFVLTSPEMCRITGLDWEGTYTAQSKRI